MIQDTAPVLLFCYKRCRHLLQSVSALQKNLLAEQSELYIFSDGAKNTFDEPAVSEVRSYLKTIKGFKKIYIIESPVNKGLANSIIEGVSQIFEKYDKVIVLEDDLVTSYNFLSFMNQALKFYEHRDVFSIAGFSFPIVGLDSSSVYFTKRASSWGWATWKNRWEKIDWQVKDFSGTMGSTRQRREFNKMGSDLSGMLEKQMQGKIDSWAIRWCYHQFRQQLYTVYPALSKVCNIGFDEEATNTKESKLRYRTILDRSNNTTFIFKENIVLDHDVVRQFTKHYSVWSRSYYKAVKLVANYSLRLQRFLNSERE